VGLDSQGTIVKRRRMRSSSVVDFTKGLPPCIIAMEACCGAHQLGRLLKAQGHEVRLMSPEYVRPYVKAQKNDDRDAEAMAEAATRPTMRFVELKSEEQLDMNGEVSIPASPPSMMSSQRARRTMRPRGVWRLSPASAC
jgi:transposase